MPSPPLEWQPCFDTRPAAPSSRGFAAGSALAGLGLWRLPAFAAPLCLPMS
nr:hypothetical protein [Pseudomonas sp. BIGb0427]